MYVQYLDQHRQNKTNVKLSLKSGNCLGWKRSEYIFQIHVIILVLTAIPERYLRSNTLVTREAVH